MERTIRVTGKGKLAVKPDLIELTLSIKDIKKEMNVTMFTIRKIKNSALKKIKNYYLMHYYN